MTAADAVAGASVAVHGDPDRGCVECGYSLHGLPRDGVCPECGTDLRRSARGELLRFAGRAYLATVCSGLGLVLSGTPLAFAAVPVSWMVMLLMIESANFVHGQLVMSTVQLVIFGCVAVGYWRYTAPDHGFTGRTRRDRARRVVRVAIVVQTMLVAGCWTYRVLSVTNAPLGTYVVPSTLFEHMTLHGGLPFVAISVVIISGTIVYTRGLAERIPDEHIVGRSRMLVWGVPVIGVLGSIVLLGPLIAIGLYWNLLDRMRRHLRSIIATGEPAHALSNIIGG